MRDDAYLADLIRVRFFLIGILGQDQRIVVIANAFAGLTEFLVKCEALFQGNEKIRDYYKALESLKLILETNARIEWLKIVRKFTLNPLPEDKPYTQKLLDALPKQNR